MKLNQSGIPMNIHSKAQHFVATYENLFHNDWSYSSEMLGVSVFDEDETFIKCEWITNWCNKDSLDASFEKTKKELEKSNYSEQKLVEHLKDFITNIEDVFDTDWEYTKLNLDIETSSDATFLHPNLDADELEIENWGFREMFLNQYQEIKLMMP